MELVRQDGSTRWCGAGRLAASAGVPALPLAADQTRPGARKVVGPRGKPAKLALSQGATQNEAGHGPVPRYREVVDALRREIASGRWPVGSKLPTEDMLGRTFGVSRHTVRIALRELREEGLVASRQGAGSTVLRLSPAVRYASSVSSLEELLQYATEVRYEVAKSGMVIANEALAARLGCPVGMRWLRLLGVRLRRQDEEPVCGTEVFVNADFAGVALLAGRRTGTIYSFIEEMYGVHIDEVRQTIHVEPMPADVAERLGCPGDGQAVVVTRYYRLLDGTLAEVAFNHHPADRFMYDLTLRKRSG